MLVDESCFEEQSKNLLFYYFHNFYKLELMPSFLSPNKMHRIFLKKQQKINSMKIVWLLITNFKKHLNEFTFRHFLMSLGMYLILLIGYFTSMFFVFFFPLFLPNILIYLKRATPLQHATNANFPSHIHIDCKELNQTQSRHCQM